MESNIISARNFKCLLFLMVFCGTFINGAFTVGQDAWIAVLLMGVFFLPLIVLYGRIAALHPGKGLFEIIDTLLGPPGKAFSLLMALYSLLAGSLVLQSFTDFTVVISLETTPRIPIMLLLMVVAMYLAVKGPTLLGRWSFLICVAMLCHLTVTFILSAGIMQPSNMLPVLNHSIKAISTDAVSIGCITVGETIMATALLGHLKKGENPYRVYMGGIAIGIGIFALISLRNLFILGPVLDQEAQYPTYMAMRVIQVGSFLERIESSISFVNIVLGITKLALNILMGAMGMAHVLGSVDYKRLLVPSALVSLTLSAVVFKHALELHDFVRIYPYLALPFQVLIPLLIWFRAELKWGFLRKNRAQPNT